MCISVHTFCPAKKTLPFLLISFLSHSEQISCMKNLDFKFVIKILVCCRNGTVTLLRSNITIWKVSIYLGKFM